jgi:hypothetical protein
MKNTIILLSALMLLMTACNKNVINLMDQSPHPDVFLETSEGVPIPAGYAELTIVSSLKTHKPGIYPFGDKFKGTPDYVLVLNIDGQRLEIKGDLTEEKTDPKGLNDPEAGEGIRYLFKKEVLLTAGKHRLCVELQRERIDVKRELTLKDGTANILRLEPNYRSSNSKGSPGRGSMSSSSFMSGIVGFWVFLNDHTL